MLARGKVLVAVLLVAVKYSLTVSPTTESLAYGLLVPIPTFPLASTINGVLSGEVESSAIKVGPVPVLVMESLPHGVVVPMPMLPVAVIRILSFTVPAFQVKNCKLPLFVAPSVATTIVEILLSVVPRTLL